MNRFRIPLALTLATLTFAAPVSFAQSDSCAAIFGNAWRAEQSRVEDRVAMLRSFIIELRTQYGQEGYKRNWLGVKLEELQERYERTLRENPESSQEDFEQLMIALSAECEDGHMNTVRNSKKYWTLGLLGASVNGHLYVWDLNPDFYSSTYSNPKLRRGDEILEIDGKPAREVANSRMKYMQSGTFNARLESALKSVINVDHRWLPAQKTGAPIVLKVRRTENGVTKDWEVQLRWGEKSELARAKLLLDAVGAKAPEAKDDYVFGEFSTPKTYFSEGLRAAFPDTPENKGKIRDLAPLIKKALELEGIKDAQSIPVYLVKHGGKTIGVLRIPEYPGKKSNMHKSLFVAAKILEKHSDVVILDHLGNGGGSNWMAVQALRLFAADKDLQSFMRESKLSRRALGFFEGDFLTKGGDMVDDENKNFAEFMLQQRVYERFEKLLSEGEVWSGPYSLHSTHMLNMPNEYGRITAYEDTKISKPLVILNDHRSASNGDQVPAILAANGRGIVIGETSEGLGGSVEGTIGNTLGSDMFTRCTNSICLLPTNLPIENIGTLVDVKREIGIDDIRDGFKTYAAQILDSTLAYLGGEKAPDLQKRVESHLAPLSPAAVSAQGAFDAIKSRVSEGASDAQILDAYRSVLGGLSAGSFSESEWSRLRLPLPERLWRKDFILASMTERDEVVHRLRQMKKVDLYAAQAQFLEDLASLLEGVGPIGVQDEVRNVTYFDNAADFFKRTH